MGWNDQLENDTLQETNIPLVEEIPNNHLGCIKPLVNNGAGFHPSTVSHRGKRNIMFIKWQVISYCQNGLDFGSNPCRLCQSFGYPKDSLREACANSLEKWKAMWSNCIYNKINLHLSYNKIHLRTYLHTSTISPMIFLIPTVVCVTPFIVFFSVFVGSSHCRFWRGWELWTHEPAMLGMNLRDETSYPAYVGITPWKINMEHNHGGLKDHFPF